MELFNIIVSTFFALGVLVIIHEFGHYIVARLCGVKVLQFSIGFGKPIFSWVDKHETEFMLSIIPLGGYVRMLDQRNEEVKAEEVDRAFDAQTLIKRIAIVAAGPIANFLLAVLLFYGLFLGGITEHKALVSHIETGSIADIAGIREGQEIISINDQEVQSRQALNRFLMNFYGEGNSDLMISTKDQNEHINTHKIQLDWSSETSASPLETLGIKLFYPQVKSILAKVLKPSPAFSAGLKKGDKLIAINGERLSSWNEWSDTFRANPGQLINLEYERDSLIYSVKITPSATKLKDQVVGQVGVVPEVEDWPKELLLMKEFSMLSAWQPAAYEVWDKTALTLGLIKKMFQGAVSIKEVGGPITIAKQANRSSKLGWKSYLSLLALLSISLGVLNLLPIPVLDGGHLLFFLIEGLRGKAVSEEVQALGYKIGAILVFSFMLFAIYNDITRL